MLWVESLELKVGNEAQRPNREPRTPNPDYEPRTPITSKITNYDYELRLRITITMTITSTNP
jgi:hypothetical protein